MDDQHIIQAARIRREQLAADLQEIALQRSELDKKEVPITSEYNELGQFLRMAEKLASDISFAELDSTLWPKEPPNSASMPATKKGAVIQAVERMLANGHRMRLRNIVLQLTLEGIVIGGKDKLQAVSQILCKDERFVSDRRLGWSLRQPNLQNDEGLGVSAPSPSDTTFSGRRAEAGGPPVVQH